MSVYPENGYLDHNATTAIGELVLEAMLPYLRTHFGNPSSGHRVGRVARAAVDSAREQVAALVNAHPSQIAVTSGGTEANNIALKGAASHRLPGTIALSAVEHSSIESSASLLQKQGWSIAKIAVDVSGRIRESKLSSIVTGV